MEPGRCGLLPPGSQSIGKVVDYYSKPKAAIIDLIGNIEVALGDILAIRLPKRYVQQEITSIQQDGRQVERARHGEIGVIIGLDKVRPKGCEVFLMPKVLVSEVSGQAVDGAGVVGSDLDSHGMNVEPPEV